MAGDNNHKYWIHKRPRGRRFLERIEGYLWAGKVVTASVMIGDVVYSGTGTFPSSAGTAGVTIAGFGGVSLVRTAYGTMEVMFIATTSTRQVQAVKLELGTVSTLAYDPPMDYGVELPKCQGYLQPIKQGVYGLNGWYMNDFL